MNNYTKVKEKYIEEIQSNVVIYRHNKTKARICTICNDDTNKVFSIAFRTPPMDNTGLTHILEHSVLCGSAKYPVKDPFVELLKSSLNTFLNAFTFPDKTMYPCASQNDKDFNNLMSVYMDAVFYPRIYQHEEIFMQEGWHYQYKNESDPITYNGVVYNEMKGAFSDPEQVLFRNIMHSLYPDTSYGFESGGDPKYIPTLSYEQFKEFHQKYYHPSNSYIFLYGDCDMEQRLDWLDKEYLSHFDYNGFDTRIVPQKPFEKPIYQTQYYAVGKEEKLTDKTFLSYNIVLPTTLDKKLMITMSILVTALFENPGAPIKEALIDAQLGQDVETMFDDGLLQPLLAIVVMNSNEEKEEEFISLVNEKLQEQVKNGLDKENLLSLINFAEFKARERMFSSRMPQGLEIEMACLSSWLYSEEEPFQKLEVLDVYEELKQDLKTNYFESVIQKYFLDNPHKSFVKLVPSYTCGEEAKKSLEDKLNQYKESLSQEQRKILIQKNHDLQDYQAQLSTREEIDTLPKLKLEDIPVEVEKLNCQRLNHTYPVLFCEYHTNDIGYVNYYFDISSTNNEDLQYAQLYSDLFTYLSTETMHYKDIHQSIMKNTGGLKAVVYAGTCMDKTSKTYFRIAYSAITERIQIVNDLVVDILNHTKWDKKRLYERLCEIKLNMEMGISNIGHIQAAKRAGSHCNETFYRSDLISGIGYLDFLTDLLNHFEQKWEGIVSNLSHLVNRLCTKKNFIIGFTGDKNQYQKAECVFDDFYQGLKEKPQYPMVQFVPNKKNEGIKTQYDVNFVAKAGMYSQKFNGAMHVLRNALSLDYLWMQVRVHGGAYGCNLMTRQDGFLAFTSYRDPSIERTEKVYSDVVSYIRGLNPSEEELLKFKIGAIGSLESVMHVSEKGLTAQQNMLMGITDEIRKQQRVEILKATKEDLIALADCFEEALKDSTLCVIGNADKVEEAKNLFDSVRNLVME